MPKAGDCRKGITAIGSEAARRISARSTITSKGQIKHGQPHDGWLRDENLLHRLNKSCDIQEQEQKGRSNNAGK